MLNKLGGTQQLTRPTSCKGRFLLPVSWMSANRPSVFIYVRKAVGRDVSSSFCRGYESYLETGRFVRLTWTRTILLIPLPSHFWNSSVRHSAHSDERTQSRRSQRSICQSCRI